METGDIMTVFQDPITKQRIEGKAKLLEEVRPDVGDGLVMWEVEFLDEPGASYSRTFYFPPEYRD